MSDRSFLDARHDIHVKNDEAWAREERRMYGGDAVLEELARWKNETDAKYTQRQTQAQYLNFGEQHASLLAGHIVREMPIPNYGTLGDVRERKRITIPTSAELLHYNVNGIGSDGSQLPDWVAAQIVRACGLGSVGTLVEMPPAPRGRAPDAPLTQADILAGHRPYFVPFSRRSVPYWEVTRGQLDWAYARVPVGVSKVIGGAWTPRSDTKGYYLWVRENYAGLGDEFAPGGWWIFDSEKETATDEDGNPLAGTWARTAGQIPFAFLKAADSEGTQDWPADSRSLTMEPNQIAVGCMNRISERDWNASDSGKSVKFIMGGEKDAHNLVVAMLDDGAIVVTVPGAMTGDGKFTVPTMYNSADGAINAEFFTTIINSNIAAAHEIMVRQLTSTPDSSGRSKEAGFGEATSPLLASLAAKTESWLNALIYFAELRAGGDRPSGFVTLTRKYELAPIMAKIDRNIDRMIKIGARSVTLEARMVEAAAADDGLMPTDEADIKLVQQQLKASLSAVRPDQSESASKLSSSGYTAEGIASAVGFSPELSALLIGGGPDGSPDQGLPEAGAVIEGEEEGEGEVEGAGARVVDTPMSPNAPAPAAPDLTPVTQELAALRSDIAALPDKIRDAFVAALAQLRQDMQPPAPPPPQQPLVIFPPDRPQLGKKVDVTVPADSERGVPSRTWSIQVTPTPTDNGATPPPS